MATIGDRYLLTLRAHSLDNTQRIQNVFAFELTAGFGGASVCATAFRVNWLPSIAAVISVQTFYDDMVVVNLDDLTDYTTQPISGAGSVAGESLPTYCSWTFEYLRTTREINNGRKAFGLVGEASQASGNPTSGVLTDLNTLANVLEAELQEVSGPSRWEPRIYRRPGTYASGVVAPPGQFFDVDQVVFRALSTQNTRKTGRGS